MYKETTFLQKLVLWWIAIFGRIKLFIHEIVNVITNFLVPVLNILTAILAILIIPIPQLKRIYIGFKKAEEFMQIAGTTAKEIDDELKKH